MHSVLHSWCWHDVMVVSPYPKHKSGHGSFSTRNFPHVKFFFYCYPWEVSITWAPSLSMSILSNESVSKFHWSLLGTCPKGTCFGNTVCRRKCYYLKWRLTPSLTLLILVWYVVVAYGRIQPHALFLWTLLLFDTFPLGPSMLCNCVVGLLLRIYTFDWVET